LFNTAVSINECNVEFRIVIGAHQIGLEHVTKHLEANRELLEQNGILYPSFKDMDAAMWPAIKALRNKKDDAYTLPRLVETLSNGKKYDRVVIVRPSISGPPNRPIKDDGFYPRGATETGQLAKLIGAEDIRFFLGIRNPANFLPSCYNLAFAEDHRLVLPEFVQLSDPYALRWSDYIQRVQGDESEMPLNVWSFEDYPYIWRSVLQGITGLPNKEDLVATEAQMTREVSIKGIGLMREYLRQHPPTSREMFDKIFEKFIERHPAFDGETVPDVWPEALVETLTDSYDDDLYYIERMENVNFIKKQVWS